MGYCRKNTNFTMVVIVGLKCPLLNSSHDMCHHLQVGNNPVILQILSSSSPQQPPSGASGRLLMSLPTNSFETIVELQKTDHVGIVNQPTMPELSMIEYNA